MAGESETRDSELFLEYALRMTKGRLRLVGLASALLVMLAVAVLFFLLAVVADHVVADGLPVGVRTALRWALVAVQACLLVGTIIYPFARRLNDLYVARIIEKAHPEFRNDLTAAIELTQSAQVGRPVLSAIRRRAADEIAASDVESSVNMRRLRAAALAFATACAVFGAYWAASGKDVWVSICRTLGDQRPAPTLVKILNVSPPPDAVVVTGELVDFSADVSRAGGPPVLRISRDGGKSFLAEDELNMQPAKELKGGGVRFQASWPAAAVNRQAVYEIFCGDARTPRRRLTVLPKPILVPVNIKLVGPGQTGWRREQTQWPIEAPPGTTVKITARANLPLAGATLRFASGPSFKVRIGSSMTEGRPEHDEYVEATFTTAASDKYSIAFDTRYVGVSGQSEWFDITADTPPSVRLINPTGRVELPANGVLGLLAEVSDDRGVRNVELVCDDAGQSGRFGLDYYPSEGKTRGSIPVGRIAQGGATVVCRIEATDNFLPDGQVGASRTFELFVKPAGGQEPPQGGAVAEARRPGEEAFDAEKTAGRQQPPPVEDRNQATARELLDMAARDADVLEKIRENLGVTPQEPVARGGALVPAGQQRQPGPGQQAGEAGAEQPAGEEIAAAGERAPADRRQPQGPQQQPGGQEQQGGAPQQPGEQIGAAGEQTPAGQPSRGAGQQPGGQDQPAGSEQQGAGQEGAAQQPSGQQPGGSDVEAPPAKGGDEISQDKGEDKPPGGQDQPAGS
ncbi:MAG: hypothetical protein ACYTF6_14690, partial [Planctomycetota bacterium]